MFDLNLIPKRYFEFRAPDNGEVLHIEPPKLKVLKMLSGERRIEDMAQAVALAMSVNRENREITCDMIMEWMNEDQLAAFLREYNAWLRREKQNDPN